MDNEMIERAAQACFEKLCPGIRYTEQDKEFYKEAQIAAIKTMREPTDKMLESVTNWYGFFKETDPLEAWHKMIDAIITDETLGSNSNPIIEANL